MSYQRAQIVVALWMAFGPLLLPLRMPLKNVPKVFVRRVGNLLDRGVGITADRRAKQKGVFQEYEVDDAVELGIGLSLLDAGMPQSEIVAFLIGFRQIIRAHVRSMPASDVNVKFPHFLIVTPRGLRETIGQFGPQPELGSWGENLPFFNPRFVATMSEWRSLAGEISWPSTTSIVIEIGGLVSRLQLSLPESVTTKRGRR